MRKILTVAVMLAMIGGAFGFYALSSTAEESGTTISLIQRVTSEVFLDNGENGLSSGDQDVFAADLYQLQSGNRVGKKLGRSGVVATVVSVDRGGGDAEASGTGTYILPGGKITGQTLLRFSEQTFTSAITGGTGIYRNAQGWVEHTDIPDSENDGIIIIHLS